MQPLFLRSALLASLIATSLSAQDPFIGKWKLNLAKSKLAGQTIEIQQVGGGYKFQEDEHSDIIFADGLDHPTHFGETMSITQKKTDTWAITYKNGDRVLMNTLWKVSKDGKTLTYTATGIRPNGIQFSNQLTAKRTGAGSGLAGKWETVSVNLSSPREIYIEPYESGGHFISFPGRKQTVRMKFDGKDYPEEGPTVPPGSTSSGRRIDDRTTETTEKIKGKIIEVAKAAISPDGRTQKIVVTEPGDPTPVVLIYEIEPKS
jgi:hypothetical protein